MRTRSHRRPGGDSAALIGFKAGLFSRVTHTQQIPLGAAASARGPGFWNRVDGFMAPRRGSSRANVQERRLERSGAGTMCSHFRSYLRITLESLLIFFL